MNEFEFASAHLGEWKQKGNEIIPKFCPFCGGGKNHDIETFALNVVNHTFNCKRGSCGRQGHFSQLCKEFGEKADGHSTSARILKSFERQKKSYKKSEIKPLTATDKVKEYLKLREISEKTAEVFGIGADEKGVMVFPFYKTMEDFENNSPTFNKFRLPQKFVKGKGKHMKMWREKDTEPILFGMHLCTPDKPLVFFEGEFDCMSAFESGIRNCVSIPSGTEDFEWIDTCYDFIEAYKTIIFFGDNDTAGMKFIETVSKKLNHHDLKICDYALYNGLKDCNEILFKYGAEQVLKILESAEPIPMYGVKELADIEPMDLSSIHKTTTGFKAFDAGYGGSLDGDMTIITGEPGAGKSTLISCILNNNIENGEKVCAYSGELTQEHYSLWAMLQAAGDDYVSFENDISTGKRVAVVNAAAKKAIRNWWRNKYYIFDLSIKDADKWDIILEVFESAYKRYDIKTFVVDNLMTVNVRGLDKDKYIAQESFIMEFSKFCKRLGVHGYLIVHPTKNTTGRITNYSELSGTATISRVANNIWAVNKASKESDFDTELLSLKSRMFGETGMAKLVFNKKTKQFAEKGCPYPVYSWRDSPEFKDCIANADKKQRTHDVKHVASDIDDDFDTIAPVDEYGDIEIPF